MGSFLRIWGGNPRTGERSVLRTQESGRFRRYRQDTGNGARSGWLCGSASLTMALAMTFSLGGRIARADRVDEALALSRETDRPLLAIGSSDFCGPCRQMADMLANDARLQPLLKQCVVLKLDSQSEEFHHLVARYPADASMIPMVYIVLPNGNPMYAQSGGLETEQMLGLLSEAVGYSRPTSLVAASSTPTPNPALRIPTADVEAILEVARQQAKIGHLVKSLKLVAPIASQSDETEVVLKARLYQSSLNQAIGQWMNELADQIDRKESVHGATYRIAELYVALPGHPKLRKQAGTLLIHLERQPATRDPVRQAKFLLKARYLERANAFQRAADAYAQAIQIDDASPSAKFAQKQVDRLQKRKSVQMTVKAG